MNAGTMRTARNTLASLALAAMAVLAGGCSYSLDGKVTEGFGSVIIGRPTDPDARKSGVQGAQIELIRDPGNMKRAVVARATSGSDGRFILDVPGFGTGWMDEEWHIRIRRSGYENVESAFRLPESTSDRLLIISMRRGTSVPFREPDNARSLMDEAKSYDPGIGGIR